MEPKRNRRRNYFINKEFQSKFIIKFCVLVIIGTIISGAIIYSMSKATVTTTFENSRLRIKSTADFILPSVLLSGAVVIVSIGFATIAVTLFTSHRIAGPLYRIDKDLKQVMSGDLTMRFNLRKGDEIKALAADLDQMTTAFRKNVADIKAAASELESAAGKEKLRRLNDAIGKFKT